MEIHLTPGVPTSPNPEKTAPAEKTLPVNLFQFSVRWNFLVSVPNQFYQRLHIEGESVDFRWGGSRAAGLGQLCAAGEKQPDCPVPSTMSLC